MADVASDLYNAFVLLASRQTVSDVLLHSCSPLVRCLIRRLKEDTLAAPRTVQRRVNRYATQTIGTFYSVVA